MCAWRSRRGCARTARQNTHCVCRRSASDFSFVLLLRHPCRSGACHCFHRHWPAAARHGAPHRRSKNAVLRAAMSVMTVSNAAVKGLGRSAASRERFVITSATQWSEAIQAEALWIASSLALLAMTKVSRIARTTMEKANDSIEQRDRAGPAGRTVLHLERETSNDESALRKLLEIAQLLHMTIRNLAAALVALP